ncbi:MAG: transporter [Lachnospiraceae bacterium]
MDFLLVFHQFIGKAFYNKQLKNILSSALLVILFFAMLFFPKAVLSGASSGLLLWFNTVLPTLFPFILICNLCIETDTVRYLLRMTSPIICRIFNVSPYGSFAVLTGFLCGYPMGSKVAADLYRHGHISRSECSYLVSFCNNTSPMFIISFLVMQNFKNKSLTIPTLFILFLSPVLCSFLFRYDLKSRKKGRENSSANTDTCNIPCASFVSSQNPLDHAISDALESITKIGAYIIAFSVLTQLFFELPVPESAIKIFLLSCLEITAGITLLCTSALPAKTIFILSLFLTSFGGFCAAFQTQSMLNGTGISIFTYLTKKLVTALVTSLLALIYLSFFI